MIYGQPVTFGGKPDLQEKTVSPTTSQQVVTPDADYDGLSKVTVNPMTTTTQATPSITVGTDGLITASATQSAGYVAAGTKSATKQLTTQAAKTVTPTTSNQTAVVSGRYTTGAVTVKGDSNLKAANIKKGVSIFGVTGTDVGAPVLLWTNASPTSNFGQQDVSVTSGYSGYLIESRHTTSVDSKGITFVAVGNTGRLVNVNTKTSAQSPDYYSSSTSRIVIASDGKLEFHSSRVDGDSSVYVNGAIPTRIWGVKFTIS